MQRRREMCSVGKKSANVSERIPMGKRNLASGEEKFGQRGREIRQRGREMSRRRTEIWLAEKRNLSSVGETCAAYKRNVQRGRFVLFGHRTHVP